MKLPSHHYHCNPVPHKCAQPQSRFRVPAHIPVSIRHQLGLPLGIGREKGLNRALGLALLPKEGGSAVSSARHTRLYPECSVGDSLQRGDPPLPHQKLMTGFFLTGFELCVWEGGTLRSRGDALPASAGLLLFLPQVSGQWNPPAANFWERCPRCRPRSLLRDFASENAFCFHICRGFPCLARGFSCDIGSAFWGRVGEKKALNISCTPGLRCSRKMHALEEVYWQAVSSAPPRHPPPRGRERVLMLSSALVPA